MGDVNRFKKLSAQHLYRVYFGGNWCEISWIEFIEKASVDALNNTSFGNSIWNLFSHSHYYLSAIKQVLNNKSLETRDANSWKDPLEVNQQRKDEFLNSVKTEVVEVCQQIENTTEQRMKDAFEKEEYGCIETNIWGIIEHLHYHLGQAVLINNQLEESK